MSKLIKISGLGLVLVLSCQLALAQNLLTEEKIWEMAQVGAPAVHPNGKLAVYSVRYTQLAENKGQNDLFSVDLVSGKSTRLTNTPASEGQYTWRPDGQWIGYLSSSSGSMQLWEMKADGSSNRQVSQVEGGIEGFGYSPDGKHIYYVKRVKLDQNLRDKYPQLSKSTGELFDGLMYRHWDHFHDGTYSHIFIQSYIDGKLTGTATDILSGENSMHLYNLLAEPVNLLGRPTAKFWYIRLKSCMELPRQPVPIAIYMRTI